MSQHSQYDHPDESEWRDQRWEDDHSTYPQTQSNDIFMTLDKDQKNKWAKAPTDTERKRQERRANLKKETESYFNGKKLMPFMGIFMIPNNNISIDQVIGTEEQKLNEIRVQSKCFIWYQDNVDYCNGFPIFENSLLTFRRYKVIKVAGDTKESVSIATARVKNLYLTFHNRPKRPVILHLLDQPSEIFKICLTQLPSGFETLSIPPEGLSYFILKKIVNVVHDLVDLGEGELSGRLPTNRELPPQVLRLNKRNTNLLEQEMNATLERIRPFNYAIRFKIRFGQFCMVCDPDPEKEYSIKAMAYKHFTGDNFIAELVPCVAKKEASIKPFKEFIDKYCPDTLVDIPRETFVFEVKQQLEFVQPSKMVQAGVSEKFPTRITCSFKSDGYVELWDCVMDEMKLMSANIVNLDRNYAWELRLDAAKPVPHHRLDAAKVVPSPSPHSKFANGLRLNKNNKLIYENSKELSVKSITWKTKWLHYWSERNYVIEICREKIWDEKLSKEKAIGLVVNLAQEPNKEIYRISMYKQDWKNRFAMNLNLGVGMAPGWTIHDFLHTNEENAAQLISDAREFADILTKNLPRYWEENIA
ncbi:hypothetical protein BC937DRAFT_90419 [Endogone sp. FLAS-F59071]|nr:hypothetical protein BC937DRAFT_90419 [Endogone sp. FLAS-F59071]|eukprot:RUS17096.1 hypothetical protein BC937DRAFT_90419 [Endogone sp. FLAS-F59071]